ncbi:hypothetical protein EMIT0P258_90160 [Pseudomonas sp. IT-P258]
MRTYCTSSFQLKFLPTYGAEVRVPHSEIVGLGMIVAAEVASRLGRLSGADQNLHHRLLRLLAQLHAAPPQSSDLAC